VFEVEEETKDELVSKDCLARDDERKGKFDIIVQRQGVDC